MTKPITRKLRCAVYTRKSTEEGLEQEFNSLHAQREACEAYVASQRSEGWALIREPYDDGGFSGGTLERPALKRLLADIEEGLVDVVVVYKIDRLSRSTKIVHFQGVNSVDQNTRSQQVRRIRDRREQILLCSPDPQSTALSATTLENNENFRPRCRTENGLGQGVGWGTWIRTRTNGVRVPH